MQAKGYKGLGMEGLIAKWYAKTTYKDLDEFKALAKRMSESLRKGRACSKWRRGRAILRSSWPSAGSTRFRGSISVRRLWRSRSKNARRQGVEIDFRHGNASSMPFEDGIFDLIVCRAAFKNFSEPVGALREMRRTLKSRGRAGDYRSSEGYAQGRD